MATAGLLIAEAASDARYLHDMVRKMLKAPAFLDSSVLSDMRELISDGLHQSDTLVLLATKQVLSRQWCLLELFETSRKVRDRNYHLSHRTRDLRRLVP